MSGQPDRQAPALNRRRVGEYVVTYLSDGFLDGSFAYLSGIDEDAAKAMMTAAHRPPLARLAIASYLVQGQGRTILVDGGAGGFNGWGGRFADALAIAGVAPGTVDTILLTHAHADHVGGLTRDGAAVFPQAEMVVHAAELGFWRDDGIMSSAGNDQRPFFLAARTAFDAYSANLTPTTGGEVAPGITLVPLPGHTPGHSGYRIASGGEQLLIWADVTHLADIQIARPEVCMAFDGDQDQARATRMRVLDEVASDRVAVAGMHFNMPGFMTVERHGSGYAKVDLPWLPSLEAV